jgi:hypothetical protein
MVDKKRVGLPAWTKRQSQLLPIGRIVPGEALFVEVDAAPLDLL